MHVHPSATRNEVVGFADGVLQIKVAAPPVKGKANSSLLAFLSKTLRVSKSSLTIIKGHTSRSKIISVAGLDPEEIKQLLSF